MVLPSLSTLIPAALEQPFRFLDLPKELRLMIFEELMDNDKNDIKFTAPHNLYVEYVYFDRMYYPSLLLVSKLFREEYWSLCLHKSVLWIFYSCDEPFHEEEDDEQDGPTIPFLSEWVEIPDKVLDRVTEVIFKFKADWMLPHIDPFVGIANCTAELPSLESIAIWSELDASAVEYGRDEAERVKRFNKFVDRLFLEQCALFELDDEEGLDLLIHVDLQLYTPLYEMNKNYCRPRRRHLQQGVAPLAGLPEWGYSMFQVAAPWDRPLENSFTYHGQELTFMRVETSLPVLDRMDTECDSPSEFDYEFDESGWATGNIPDWS